jgi:hypothetical protein
MPLSLSALVYAPVIQPQFSAFSQAPISLAATLA